MLLVGRHRTRTCQGITRRALLQVGASTALGLSLPDLLRQRGQAGGVLQGSAKSVMLLWLWGGPSQLDTWDPKPGAPLEFRGPLGTIATRVPGLRFTELFPQIANLTNRIAVLRSLRTGSNDHGVAGTIGLTGSSAGAVGLDGKPLAGSARPTVGSTVARVRGLGGKLPPFMVVGGKLHQGKKAIVGEGGGALGGLYDPFAWNTTPSTARGCRRSSCLPTSRPNGSPTAGVCLGSSTASTAGPMRSARRGCWTTTAARPSPCSPRRPLARRSTCRPNQPG
jgi:hypothetical protein